MLTALLLIALIPVINTEIYYSLIFAATIGLFFSINQTLKLRVIDIGDINSFGLANLLKK